MDRNCLSYWFPKLRAAGIPVPKTEIVTTDVDLAGILDGQAPAGLKEFFDAIAAACERIGSWPIFLRTGQGAGKHNFKHTCCLQNASMIGPNVGALVEWSHLVDMVSYLPTDVWVCREMLPVTPLCTLPYYGDMPLVREYRGFVEGGEVRCTHPYWPRRSVEEGFPRRRLPASAEGAYHGDSILDGDLADPGRELPPNFDAIMARLSLPSPPEVTMLLSDVAVVFDHDGAWSVDVLETSKGWFITDLAEAAQSFHWPECPNIFLEK